MVQIKYFTAPLKMPNFQFPRRANWPWQDKILSAPQSGKKIIVNQSKLSLFQAKLFFDAKLSGRFIMRLPLKTRKWRGQFVFFRTLPSMGEWSHSCCDVGNCQYLFFLIISFGYCKRESSLFFVRFMVDVEEIEILKSWNPCCYDGKLVSLFI